MDRVVLLAVFGMLTFVGLFAGSCVLFGNANLEKRFYRQTTGGKKSVREWLRFIKKPEGLLKPLGRLIPRSPEEMSRQEQRLTKAGIRRKDGPVLLYGAKAALAIALLVVFTATRLLHTNPVLYVILSVFLGAFLTDIWLTQRIRRRTDRIQLALPNALDLAVVCVEAGLGLDQSLTRIGQELRKGYPELSDEFRLLNLEVNAGRKRADALRNMGKRTDSKDLRALAAVLIQADRFGTSIAQSLRAFAEGMRTTRRQRSEEHAAKMSVKMIPPLVFFILPALFIVILGATIISISRNMLPLFGGS